MASGRVNPTYAVILGVCLAVFALALAFYVDLGFGFVLGTYFGVNLAYTFGLKRVSILDVIIVAIGFNLRIKAGSIVADVPLSEWVVIMVFLLSLFMALGKRRDDVLLKQATGVDMRASSGSYNLDYLNVLIALICAVIIVAYLMYTISPAVYVRLGTHRLYYTCLFVIAGVFRYLQIIFVNGNSESPTKIFLKDRFIQISIALWIASFIFLIYFKNYKVF
jgi:4-hydroxybenzoate polyprenyltransferase